MPVPRVLTIPPGAAFLATFAAALRDGGIIPGLSAASGPLALARTTIYVPTRRSARALMQELSRAFDGQSVLLPRILPLGGLEETRTGLIFSTSDATALPVPDVPPAIGEIERRMLLAQLVQKWAQALPHAIVSVNAAGEPEFDDAETLLVATSFAGAWHLAGDLAGLIDELIIEDIAWSALDDLGDEHDIYWRITTHFLDIAITGWPGILAQRGKVDRARHQAQLVEAQIAQLQAADGAAPVIAIGSTGSNRATARLLAAIAASPQGAVVLPGLDLDLDASAFALIGGAGDARVDPAQGHPQAALWRLLPELGIGREHVASLGAASPALAARARFLTQALRPADSTETWAAYLAQAEPEIIAGLADVTLVEAANEREEALALAIALRQALEDPQATAALITPNRDIATRVRAELARWNIDVDDSGGEPLGVTPQGALARLVLACVQSRHAAIDMIAMLAHPLVLLAHARGDIDRLAPLVEIGILRAVTPTLPFGETAGLVEAARLSARHRHAHAARARIGDGEWDEIGTLLTAFNAALAPLDALTGQAPLAEWLLAHRAALDALTLGPDGAAPIGEDGDVLASLLDELEAAALPDIALDCQSYQHFFDQLCREAVVRGPRRAHPRLKILGLLEARLMRADLVLLAGLDESIWPPQAHTDAFLNRPMRARLGLSAPERRIGQSAHDFVQAMGNPRVIISRAAKRGGTPMVASRFVQRMAALAGPAFEACRERGKGLLHWAQALDLPRHIRHIPRPKPCPPLDLRPTRLSVTRIETLRRDPFAIFAQYILELQPLDPLGLEMGAREMGLFLHEVLAQFTRLHPGGALPASAPAQLLGMTRAAMQPLLDNAAFRSFQWPRVQEALTCFLRFELARRENIAKIYVEEFGSMEIGLDDGSLFRLTAIADRLELAHDKSVTIVDFKTGAVPGLNEVRVGFAPQLTLEAVMVDCAAFKGLPEGVTGAGALYLKLGGADGGRVVDMASLDTDFLEVKSDHYEGLILLLNQFRNVETPYLSRPYPKFIARFGAYDHLARVREWSAGQAGENA